VNNKWLGSFYRSLQLQHVSTVDEQLQSFNQGT